MIRARKQTGRQIMDIEADKVIASLKQIIADQAEQIAILKEMIDKLKETTNS